jgi:hypothetical protein
MCGKIFIFLKVFRKMCNTGAIARGHLKIFLFLLKKLFLRENRKNGVFRENGNFSTIFAKSHQNSLNFVEK